ncbi:MAG: hypothetical protein HY083_08050 [Gammaproteobacteria bacterium]|nr:hypothetical protein [Gammaproteobacteria bacterium]
MAAVILLHACAGVPAQTAADPIPTPQHIPVCSGYGCRIIDSVSLSDVEWRSVRAVFVPRAESPADERRQIARAIAQLEKIIGPKTETEHDKGGTFPGLFEDGQMDCIDESTNTTVYLRLLAANDLLRWHEVWPDATRGYFLFGWPHTTATVREKPSGDDSMDGGGRAAPGAVAEEYAVDSWFFDNGVEPVIIPLKLWRDGWNPPTAKP